MSLVSIRASIDFWELASKYDGSRGRLNSIGIKHFQNLPERAKWTITLLVVARSSSLIPPVISRVWIHDVEVEDVCVVKDLL